MSSLMILKLIIEFGQLSFEVQNRLSLEQFRIDVRWFGSSNGALRYLD